MTNKNSAGDTTSSANSANSANSAQNLIRPEMTPNPQTMRFVADRVLTESPREFKTPQETISSPLARKLFGFPWTAGVFIGRDFVSVTKQDWVDWETLAEPLAGLIAEHLERGEPVLHASAAKTGATGTGTEIASSSSGEAISADDSPAVQLIKKILNDEIRPAVALDGGDIVFHKYENGIVHLFMQGACSGCPSSTMTLKMGIEARLKEALPEIREVVSV